MKHWLLVGFSLFLLLFLSACTTDSDDLNTSGIEAEMKVIVGQSGAVARADLGVTGGAGPVELSAGDKLSVTTDLNVQKTLYRAGKEGRYEANFDFSEFSNEFIFNFQRSNDKEDDAPNSTVTVPAIFNITSPSENSEYPNDDATTIDLIWDTNTTGVVMIDMTSACDDDKIPQNSEREITTEDDGAYPIGDLDGFYPVIGNVSCELKIELHKSNTGNADNHLSGGSEITAERTDTVTVKLLAY